MSISEKDRDFNQEFDKPVAADVEVSDAAESPAAGEASKNPFRRFANWIKSWRLWVKILVLVLAVVLCTGGVLAAEVYNTMKDMADKMNQDTEIPETYDLSIQPVDGFINILLLGVDTRDMEEIKGSRSDMIMIASINTKTYDVTLTSVYRDTYMKLGDTPTYDKITHACIYGGPEMTIKSLNQALDLNIDHYAVVNFKAVADIVDAVGGITVNIEENEIQQLNKYTKATAKNIGRKDYKLVEEPGEQTLSGVQAVSYGRIRKGVGDDYKRTERMRTVVSLVFKKLKGLPFSHLKQIVNIGVAQCRTNLKLNDILALGKDITKYNISSGEGFPYEVREKTLNGVSYVFPANLAMSTIRLHQAVFGQEDYRLSDTALYIANTIYSKLTGYAYAPVDYENAVPKEEETTEETEDSAAEGTGEESSGS